MTRCPILLSVCREVEGSHSSSRLAERRYIHSAGLNGSHQFWCYQTTNTLKMGTEFVPASSENLHILTRLSAPENFSELKTSLFFDQSDLLIQVAIVRIFCTILLYQFCTPSKFIKSCISITAIPNVQTIWYEDCL